MRGWLSLFTRERNLQRYRTGIFMATAEPELIRKALGTLRQQFLEVDFTLVGPRAYDEVFRGAGKPLWLEDLKLNPLRALSRLRKQRFEIAAVVLAGRPTFFKPKLMTFFLNPARFVVFNETADGFALDLAHWKLAGSQFFRRSRFVRPGAIFFFPFGLLYLLLRMLRLRFSGRVQLSAPSRK